MLQSPGNGLCVSNQKLLFIFWIISSLFHTIYVKSLPSKSKFLIIITLLPQCISVNYINMCVLCILRLIFDCTWHKNRTFALPIWLTTFHYSFQNCKWPNPHLCFTGAWKRLASQYWWLYWSIHCQLCTIALVWMFLNYSECGNSVPLTIL